MAQHLGNVGVTFSLGCGLILFLERQRYMSELLAFIKEPNDYWTVKGAMFSTGWTTAVMLTASNCSRTAGWHRFDNEH
jgi:hypothetical protein